MKKFERPRFIRRRSFRRKSERNLSRRDIAVLDFLWTWKVASTPLLKEVAFSNKSPWWVYKALRQLKNENYIQSLPRGKFIEQELWALTGLGFEVVLMDRDDLMVYRYKPHAPAHDYLATCLQLGPQGHLHTSGREYFTEQMLSSLTPANFPKSFRKIDSHIPDGLTLYRNGGREAIVGYEVDLNLKSEDRYESTFDYYTRGAQAHLIVWLVKSIWIAERIVATIERYDFGGGAKSFLAKIAFIGLDDFTNRIWDAECLRGGLRGISIRKLHANLSQSIGKPAPNIRQKDLGAIFFPKHKSPQKSLQYAATQREQSFKHPTGPGGIASSSLCALDTPSESPPSDNLNPKGDKSL